MSNKAITLSPSLLLFLEQQEDVQTIEAPAGAPICQSGDFCESLFIVLEGQVKVYRPAENGRSLTLYYVNATESCILTASCIINGMPFPAYAETLTKVKALSIPPLKVKQWLESEPLWQQYILGLLSQRMSSLIELVNALAFQGLDKRLSLWLLERSSLNPQKTIETTHQSIANELASSREVISRMLKDFEKDGLIKLSRGSIQILDKELLEKGFC